jgi:type I restriction enzyme S subunit
MPLLPEQRRIVARIEKFVTFIAEARNLHLKAVQLADESMEQFIEHSLSSLPIDGTLGDVIVSRPRSGPSFVTNSDWSGASVLMPSSVTDFGVNMSKIEHGIGDERISPKDRLKEGDILIARGNKRDQVGNAGVVPKEANNYVCANLLMKMRLDENRADNNFCIYWLRSPTMRRYVSEHMNGTNPNIQKINQRTILGFPYATSTSVTHQRSIVVYLDNLQAKADALQLLQKETTIELDALLPSILDKAFKGKLN